MMGDRGWPGYHPERDALWRAIGWLRLAVLLQAAAILVLAVVVHGWH